MAPANGPLQPFTTLFSCTVTLSTPYQIHPPTCTLESLLNCPTTHRLLLALKFLLPLSTVLLHLHLCLLLRLLQTPGLPWKQKKRQRVGVDPLTKQDSMVIPFQKVFLPSLSQPGARF